MKRFHFLKLICCITACLMLCSCVPYQTPALPSAESSDSSIERVSEPASEQTSSEEISEESKPESSKETSSKPESSKPGCHHSPEADRTLTTSSEEKKRSCLPDE